jgi:hypothetical protein
MATATAPSCVMSIGETAGAIWRILSENGPVTITKMIKVVDEPRDAVMLALGWLAREDKISIDGSGNSRKISLRS